MITAVLFDLFETLITEAPAEPTRAGSLAPALGLDRQAYRALWKVRRPRVVVGQQSFASALSEISETLTGWVDPAAVQRLCEQRLREKAEAYARPDDRVVGLVSELTRRRLPLAVISNGFREDVAGWPGCVLAPAFSCTAFSCDEGVAKPDPEIYLRALHRIRVKPDSALYIGDGGDHELAGAEAAGIRAARAAWFAPPASQPLPWTEFTRCEDVVTFVAVG